MRPDHRLELAHQRSTLGRQVQRIGTLVARRLPPFRQSALLKLIQHTDEIGALDPERLGDLALGQPRIALDYGEHGELRRADVEWCEGREEILEHREMGAPQDIPDQLSHWPKIVGCSFAHPTPPLHRHVIRAAARAKRPSCIGWYKSGLGWNRFAVVSRGPR